MKVDQTKLAEAIKTLSLACSQLSMCLNGEDEKQAEADSAKSKSKPAKSKSKPAKSKSKPNPDNSEISKDVLKLCDRHGDDFKREIGVILKKKFKVKRISNLKSESIPDFLKLVRITTDKYKKGSSKQLTKSSMTNFLKKQVKLVGKPEVIKRIKELGYKGFGAVPESKYAELQSMFEIQEPKITYKQMLSKLKEYQKLSSGPEVMKFLKQYGAKKSNDIKPEFFKEVMDKLDVLIEEADSEF